MFVPSLVEISLNVLEKEMEIRKVLADDDYDDSQHTNFDEGKLTESTPQELKGVYLNYIDPYIYFLLKK